MCECMCVVQGVGVEPEAERHVLPILAHGLLRVGEENEPGEGEVQGPQRVSLGPQGPPDGPRLRVRWKTSGRGRRSSVGPQRGAGLAAVRAVREAHLTSHLADDRALRANPEPPEHPLPPPPTSPPLPLPLSLSLPLPLPSYRRRRRRRPSHALAVLATGGRPSRVPTTKVLPMLTSTTPHAKRLTTGNMGRVAAQESNVLKRWAVLACMFGLGGACET